jgi:hypothetical protein
MAFQLRPVFYSGYRTPHDHNQNIGYVINTLFIACRFTIHSLGYQGSGIIIQGITRSEIRVKDSSPSDGPK